MIRVSTLSDTVSDVYKRQADGGVGEVQVAQVGVEFGTGVDVVGERLYFVGRHGQVGEVDNTLLADRTDTLLRCGRLSLDAALWPLIRKEVVIRSFALGICLAFAAGAMLYIASRRINTRV